MKSIETKSKKQFTVNGVVGFVCAALVLWMFGYIYETGETESYHLPERLQPFYSSPIARPIDSQKCVECHQDQVDRFANAPHHNTLMSADDPRAMELLAEKTFSDEELGRSFVYEKRDDGIWLQSNDRDVALKVDWLFGSGHHAITPVSVIQTTDDASIVLQHVISWYPGNTLGWTLGTAGQQRSLPGIHGLGEPLAADESRECFECHTTWSPQKKREFDFDHIIAGVNCTRCHTNASAHIADPDFQSIQKWSDLTPLESVNRCGECHRRADHFTADELSTSNKLLIRFASASLTQSPCFKGQTKKHRMDCITCHDPHQPASSSPQFYNKRCASCHQESDLQHCSSAQTSAECIQCHMPKVEIHEGLEFTDHWIRIRE